MCAWVGCTVLLLRVWVCVRAPGRRRRVSPSRPGARSASGARCEREGGGACRPLSLAPPSALSPPLSLSVHSHSPIADLSDPASTDFMSAACLRSSWVCLAARTRSKGMSSFAWTVIESVGASAAASPKRGQARRASAAYMGEVRVERAHSRCVRAWAGAGGERTAGTFSLFARRRRRRREQEGKKKRRRPSIDARRRRPPPPPLLLQNSPCTPCAPPWTPGSWSSP